MSQPTGTATTSARRPGDVLRPAAAVYITAVVLCAAGGLVLATQAYGARAGLHANRDLLPLVALSLIAIGTQLFEVRTPNNKAYVATVGFLIAAALLLPPVQAAIVTAAAFVVEMVVRRKKPYIEAFNVASQILCQLCAFAVFHVLSGQPADATHLTGDLRSLLASVGAVTAFLVVNHVTLAAVLFLARSVSPQATGLFGRESLLTDTALLALGVVVAGLWSLGPALVAFALLPFVLLQRALHFPALRQASRTDPKTGLANAAWFTEQAEEELRRAERMGQPVSVLVCDLDLLRNINNAYGHLAGDVVLKGIADVLRREVRDYDIPSRFGGEEFAVLLPASDQAEATAVAERIRAQVARESFEVSTSVEPISVTVSVGVATYDEHGRTLKELLHAADLALYRAKVEGRDRVRVARAEDGTSQAPDAALATSSLPSPASPVHRLLGTTPATAPATPATLRITDAVPAQLPRDSWVEHDDPVPAQERASGPRRATWPVTLGTVAASAGLAWLAIVQRPTPTLAILVFPLLALIAELMGEDVYGSSSVSLSAIPMLAAAATGRPIAAVITAIVSGIAGSMTSRSLRFEQLVFNIANFVLAASVAVSIRLAVPLSHDARHALPFLLPLMLGIALLYFVLDNGLVALVVSRDEGRDLVSVFRGDLGWLAPHFASYGILGALLGAAYDTFGLWGLAVFLLPIALLRLAQRQYLARTTGHVAALRRLTDDLSVSKAQVEETNTALQVALASVSEAHRSTATALASAIDARDSITGGHIERVTALGIALCEIVDPTLAADPQVAFGFLLHDVGKIGVPDAVLLKAGGLDVTEQAVMRQHPEIGARIVTAAGFADVAKEIVSTHHERWDGGGYPKGLKGTQIPLCSRLFSVADAMDAMVSDRPYRKGMPLEEAYDELRRHSGSQFDPMAIEALLSLEPTRVAALLRLSAERLVAGSAASTARLSLPA